jgi:menaquinone-specific isochorismate synthase
MFLKSTSFAKSGSLISLSHERVLVGWGKKTYFKEPTQPSTSWFYFPNFFLNDQKPWFTHEHTAEFSLEELKSFFHKENERPNYFWQPPQKKIFFTQFEHLQQLFRQNKLMKAVPYTFQSCSQGMSEEQLYRSIGSGLTYTQKFNCYLYGTWTKDRGILGVTPELLFRLSNRDIRTCALAGTGTSWEQLSLSKISEEHRWVIEGIENSLKRFGMPSSGQTEALKLSHFLHLSTPIHVHAKSSPSFQQIVRALHPTPALGTFPQRIGRPWLRHYQKLLPRYRYGAPVGVSKNGCDFSCYVAIRNVQWFPHRMSIGAGCGVTSASQLEEEWLELLLKIKSIKEMLSL